jgi:hypothetical protein
MTWLITLNLVISIGVMLNISSLIGDILSE